MYFLPRTRIGKISFWTGISAFALIYLQYWFALLFQTSVVFPGFLAVALVILSGALSAISLTKYRDHSLLLLLSTALGCLGILLVAGEFIFPH